MLEYTKMILQKVSFDSILFEKELRKATSTLVGEELSTLYMWCTNFFGEQYPEAIQRSFEKFLSHEQYIELIRMANQAGLL